MSAVSPEPERHSSDLPPQQGATPREELRIYSHSPLFYWWPVWAVGFVCALITLAGGVEIQFAEGEPTELVHRSRGLGVVFTVVLLLTIISSNVALRGLASVVAAISVLFLVVLFAYLGWWDAILRQLPRLSLHMNLGFYVFFSLLMFLVWAVATFVYDRMSYWTIRPGQITHEVVIGGAEKSYDTHGMVFEKVREDLFRHYFLGLGSGDLRITTMGAKREELYVPNVLFVDRKVDTMQKMISTRPSDFGAPAIQ